MTTPYMDFDEIYNVEREKILDEVLKRLDKEVELVINKKVGQFYLGLQHAKLIVKDMKK